MSYSVAFYPEADDGSTSTRSGVPEWVSLMPEPPMPTSLPEETPAPVVTVARRPRRQRTPGRWVVSAFAGLTLGIIGAMFYACLFIMIGVEVHAGALVIGVLTGAGMRLGGRRDTVSTSLAAAVLSLGMLYVGSAMGHACVAALATGEDVQALVMAYLTNPSMVVSEYFFEPMTAMIGVALVLGGAVFATATFAHKRQ